MVEIGKGGFLNPEKILRDLNLIKPNMKIADFGCGAGYFTIPLAKIVRAGGNISAIDILDTALQSVRSRAKFEGLFNVDIIKGDLETVNGSRLKNESQDIVLVSNLLFQVNDKETLLKETKRVLKQDGKLVAIEWIPNTTLGPTENLKVSEEEVKRLAEAQGFVLEEKFNPDEFHYGLIFSK